MAQNPGGGHGSAAISATQKLEHFFKTLSHDEQKVIVDMVRASLLHAADEFPAQGAQTQVPDFVTGITGHNTPEIIKGLRFPGSLAAHSIPGCNARALLAIKDKTA